MKADAALSLLAQQSNTPLLFPQALVRNVKTNRVAGRFTVQEALDILLANTGITGELSITGVLTVKPLGPGKLTTEEKNMKLEKARFASLTVFLASFFGASAEVVSQQEEVIQDDKATIIEEVVVKGFRGALKDSLNVKRNSSQVVEAISQEDIGALPDVTIADSLGRLPGLFATRDRGNAAFISARGIGPRLSLSMLDGREQPTSEPDRSIRYEQYPSELIGGVQVFKTQNASLVEGGVGATINLDLIDPLEYGERLGTLKAGTLYYEDADDFPLASAHGARFSGTWVDQFMDNKVGVVAGYSYQDQPSVLGHYDHWGFSGSTGDANGDGAPDEGFWGSGPTIISGEQVRQSAMAKVQFAPTDNFVLTLDAYFADRDIKEFEAGNWNCCWDNSGGYQDASFSNAVIQNGRVVAGTIDATGIGLTQFSSRWLEQHQRASTGMNAKWNTDDGWEINADVSYSKADRDNVWRAITLGSNGNTPLTVNFDTSVTSPPQVSYDQSVTDLSDFNIGNLLVSDNGYLGDTIIAAKFDVTRELDFAAVPAIQVGVRYSDRDKYYRERNWNQAPLSADTSMIPTSLVSSFDIPGAPQPILIDFDEGVDAIYGGTDDASLYPIDHLQSFDVSEETVAGYVMAELDTGLGDIPISGNLGIRLVHTTQESTGFEQVAGSFQEATEGLSYTEVLPSLNLNFTINDASLVRFAVARAMARAPLDEMRIARSRGIPVPGQPVNVSGGNPRLKPFLANQVDLTYEWYFSDEGLAAINLFYKDLESYVVITESQTTVAGRDALLTGSANGSGGNIRGIELTFQSPFTFLPAPFNDFGLFASYTHAGTNIREVNGELLNGLVKNNVAAQLWYNRGPFEARLGYTYRSEGTQQLNWGPGSLALLKSADYLDLTVSWDITDNLEIRGNAANLTDEPSDHTVQPIDGVDYLGRFRPSGRRFELGVTYQF